MQSELTVWVNYRVAGIVTTRETNHYFNFLSQKIDYLPFSLVTPLARFANQATKFGAILDSTVDRISEAAIFCGLLIWYLPKGATSEIVAIFAALIGSFLVSYIRARAEGLGLECRVGLFTRAERVIVLAVGLLVNQVFIAL
ncbi:unnamed protein product, partial [marine sediment metagenome]